MRNTLGDCVTVTLFGESHGKSIGAVLDGVAPGIKVDTDFLESQLCKRRPQGQLETSRKELDQYTILSGVFQGYTTGAPLTIVIENQDVRSDDYQDMSHLPRPSHADYAAFVKYHGYSDYRGGGHFSGRMTAPLVAVGAIVQKALEQKQIYIGTHILSCGGIKDRAFQDYTKDIQMLQTKHFPVLDDVEQQMKAKIEEAFFNQDSLGGILQTAIIGLPAGLGEPWFSSVEGKLANALFSIGGIKGVEFGDGFGFANMTGAKANDAFYIENQMIRTKTNHNGGINGGITNGMPVWFNIAVKPTPSIGQLQETVDLIQKKETSIQIQGRHDPAIIRRIAVVVDSLVAIVVADLLASRYGNDFLTFEE
ncbi:MAG: chorismate synthase [Prevotella sp.]|nr:chorismate synthase [Staphylococcus sp.]MCM1350400.1 chorismate synthase [Prevotella sp.]